MNLQLLRHFVSQGISEKSARYRQTERTDPHSTRPVRYKLHNGKRLRPPIFPVENTTLFAIVINLKTAKALGLTVPEKLLALADEAIE